jgi:hypothetical protein
MGGASLFLYALIWLRTGPIDEPDWWGKSWDAHEPDPKPKTSAGREKK